MSYGRSSHHSKDLFQFVLYISLLSEIPKFNTYPTYKNGLQLIRMGCYWYYYSNQEAELIRMIASVCDPLLNLSVLYNSC